MDKSVPKQLVSPDCIAAGIGLADRTEICGLLAVLEAASALQLAQGAVAAVQDKFGVEATQLRERIAKIADTLSCGTIPTDVLRHRLWLGIGRALGAEALLPLSTRHMREATCAFGVRAAERLGPGLLAHEEEEAFAKSSIGSRIFGKALDLAEKIAGQKTARSMSFPDIVAGELDIFLKSLNAADAEGSLDPAIAESQSWLPTARCRDLI